MAVDALLLLLLLGKRATLLVAAGDTAAVFNEVINGVEQREREGREGAEGRKEAFII